MALDKVIDSAELDANLTAVADAIRTKGGTSEALSFPDGFVSAVEGIQAGGGDDVAKSIIDRSITEYSDSEVKSIGAYAFNECASLTTINLPNAEHIGGRAFNNCKSLTNFNLQNVKTVDDYIFSGCTALTNIRLEGLTTASKESAFRGTNAVEMDFPNLTSLARYSFTGSSKLVTCKIPNVTALLQEDFINCGALKNVDVSALKTVGYKAFSQCGLEKIDLPVCASINNSAFYSSGSINVVILRSTENVCSLQASNVFDKTPIVSGTGYIYVPSALVDSYKSATNWSTFADQIRAIEDYPEICGEVTA